MARG
ncbi:hypothetical protein CAJAP_01399 [Camponotus japonicus]|jgi:hypothetical protein